MKSTPVPHQILYVLPVMYGILQENGVSTFGYICESKIFEVISVYLFAVRFSSTVLLILDNYTAFRVCLWKFWYFCKLVKVTLLRDTEESHITAPSQPVEFEGALQMVGL